MNRKFETNVFSKKRIGDNSDYYTENYANLHKNNNNSNDKKIKLSNNQLRDNYENIDDRTLEKLKKSTILSKNEISDLQLELFGNLSKPVQFSTFNGDNKEEDDNILSITRYFDILLLYEEFKQSIDNLSIIQQQQQQQQKNKKLLPIIHKIEEGSILYLKLYSWNKFNNITDPFIQFINSHLCSKKIPITFKNEDNNIVKNNMNNPVTVKKSLKTSPLNKNNLSDKTDSLVNIQNKVIVSHFDRKKYTCIDILGPVESVLDAMVMKITLYKDIILFYFEWSDPMDFIFIMGFNVFFKEESFRNSISNIVITLYRKDILEYVESDEMKYDDQDDKKKDNKNNTKKKVHFKDQENEYNLISKKSFNPLHNKDKNNFNDNNVIEDEENDDLSKKMEILSEDEDNKIYYISTENIIQESVKNIKLLLNSKKELQTSFISYINSGYIKRDD